MQRGCEHVGWVWMVEWSIIGLLVATSLLARKIVLAQRAQFAGPALSSRGSQRFKAGAKDIECLD